jgi:single-stranded DNA-binding protein
MAAKPVKALTAVVTEGEAVELNLAVVCGACSSPPEVRVLESGTRVASLSVRAPASSKSGSSRAASSGAGDRATSVPVTVWDPPAWVEQLDTGDPVVVVGQVRRRFYSRPGGVGSRVDLEATTIARARDRRRVDAALRRAASSLDDLR